MNDYSIWDDLWEMMTVPIEDNFWGYFLIILFWILLLALLCGVVYGILLMIDSLFRPVLDGVGTITGRRHTPAHTTTHWTYNSALKISTPITQYHPDRWYLCIDINGVVGNFDISEDSFYNLKQGQQVFCRYATGRIWKTIYIKSLQP